MVGVFYSFIGFGNFKLFFCLAFGKKKDRVFMLGAGGAQLDFGGYFNSGKGQSLGKC